MSIRQTAVTQISAFHTEEDQGPKILMMFQVIITDVRCHQICLVHNFGDQKLTIQREASGSVSGEVHGG